MLFLRGDPGLSNSYRCTSKTWNSTSSKGLQGFQEHSQALIWSKPVEICWLLQSSANLYQVGIWPSAFINYHTHSEMKNTFITKQRKTRQLHKLPKGKVLAQLGLKGHHLGGTGHIPARSRLALTDADWRWWRETRQLFGVPPCPIFLWCLLFNKGSSLPCWYKLYQPRPGNVLQEQRAQWAVRLSLDRILRTKLGFLGLKLWRGWPGAPGRVGLHTVYMVDKFRAAKFPRAFLCLVWEVSHGLRKDL